MGVGFLTIEAGVLARLRPGWTCRTERGWWRSLRADESPPLPAWMGGAESWMLTPAEQSRVCWADFTPDLDALICTQQDQNSVHFWNLRELRRRLAELGLDWEVVAPLARK